jgi:signal peptide peptidase SppA
MALSRESIRAWLAKLPIESLRNPPPVVSVLRLSGPIGTVGLGRSGLSLARLAPAIERAFTLPLVKAVALSINSPGGSPVQSALIAKRIRALSVERKIPVVAFVEDAAASGGYWLACAADEIYADANSIVGSIGVVSSSFGFADLMRRLGVRRRLYTSGDRKSLLDPFQPEDPEDVARLKAIQRDIHDSFQAFVRERRGDRLKVPDSELFSGEFWTGRRGLELGLVDGIDDLRTAMRRRFGDEVRLRPIGGEPIWWRRMVRIGRGGELDSLLAHDPHWAAELLAAAESRALWSRYGL